MATKAKALTENHPLSDLIPEEFFLDDYVTREIAGVSDLDILARAKELGHNVLLQGPTGSAKTSLVYAFASKHKLPVVNVPCNGAATPEFFVGKWGINSEGKPEFFEGDLTKAVRNGGVIYLDEVNFLPAKIGAYLHGLLDKRRTLSIPEASGSSTPTSIVAHENCFIIGAYNRGYEGTKPLNKAFKNRHCIQLDFPYLKEVEEQLVDSGTLLQFADNLRQQVSVGSIETPVSTNLLIEFQQIALDDVFGFDFAVHNFITHFEDDEQQVVLETLTQFVPAIYNELFDEEYPSDGAYSTSKYQVQ